MMGVEEVPRRATRASRGIVIPKIPFDLDEEPRRRPLSSSPNKSAARTEVSKKPLPKVSDNRDVFCWVCHKEGNNTVLCAACPRIFHRRCVKPPTNIDSAVWACLECCSRGRAESVEFRSPAMRWLDSSPNSSLCNLLHHTLERLRSCQGSEHFNEPVDESEYPAYRDYVIHPMSLKQIEENILALSYQSTEAFIADIRWLHHNSYVFNSVYSPLTSTARLLLKTARSEVEEIESCPSCYDHANTLPEDEWFSETCDPPHLLVWAKLRGWPYWPGKLFKLVNDNNEADIRFFSDHNKANVPVECIYLLSNNPPLPPRSRTSEYEDAMGELSEHIARLKSRFGSFKFAKSNVSFDARRINHDIRAMLPDYKFPSHVIDDSPSQQKEIPVDDIEDKTSQKRPPSPDVQDGPSPKSRCLLLSSPTSDLPVISSYGTINCKNQSSNKEVETIEEDKVPEPAAETKEEEPSSQERSDKEDLPEGISRETASAESPKTEEKSPQPLRGLKVKSQLELLSPAALSQSEIVMSSKKEEALKNAVNTIAQVAAGNYTVKPKERELKAIEISDSSEEEDCDDDDDNVLYKELKQIEDEAAQPKMRSLSPGPETRTEVFAWTKEYKTFSSSVTDSFDKLLLSATGVDKAFLEKVKFLVDAQKQEMADLYSKIREEATELCEVLGLESEMVERKRQQVVEKEKHFKLTQWCAHCLAEANFYCCWGTSYCSVVCQKSDWAKHFANCRQKKPSGSESLTEDITTERFLVGKEPQVGQNVVSMVNSNRQVIRLGTDKTVIKPKIPLKTISLPAITKPVALPVKRAATGAQSVFKLVSSTDSSNLLEKGRLVLAASSSKPPAKPVVIGQAAGNGHKYFLIKKGHDATTPIIAQPLKVVPKSISDN